MNIISVIMLVFLECALSLDNALALAAMIKDLPPVQRRKALTYGVAGAFTFRFFALFMLTTLIQQPLFKILAGLYLVMMFIKYFCSSLQSGEDAPKAVNTLNFWKIVAAVELTDLAFSADSIFVGAAVSQDIRIVFAGAVIGILAMRVAANHLVKLMAKFPNLERSAYLLVGTVGVKLVLEGWDVHAQPGLYYSLMVLAVVTGVLPVKAPASLP